MLSLATLSKHNQLHPPAKTDQVYGNVFDHGHFSMLRTTRLVAESM
jgi:hypothetical protein